MGTVITFDMAFSKIVYLCGKYKVKYIVFFMNFEVFKAFPCKDCSKSDEKVIISDF